MCPRTNTYNANILNANTLNANTHNANTLNIKTLNENSLTSDLNPELITYISESNLWCGLEIGNIHPSAKLTLHPK